MSRAFAGGTGDLARREWPSGGHVFDGFDALVIGWRQHANAGTCAAGAIVITGTFAHSRIARPERTPALSCRGRSR